MESKHMNRSSAKAYGSPRLRVYGSVLELTAGGTGTMTETGGKKGATQSCYDGVNQGPLTSRKHCV